LPPTLRFFRPWAVGKLGVHASQTNPAFARATACNDAQSATG
jgi:hypothetical protein